MAVTLSALLTKTSANTFSWLIPSFKAQENEAVLGSHIRAKDDDDNDCGGEKCNCDLSSNAYGKGTCNSGPYPYQRCIPEKGKDPPKPSALKTEDNAYQNQKNES